MGPTLAALADTTIALCGADLGAALDGAFAPLWSTIAVRRGQILSLGRARSGARAYLAVSGGFESDRVLGSRSTYLRGGIGRALSAGDVVFSGQADRSGVPGRSVCAEEIPANPDRRSIQTVRVIMGPHEDAFTAVGRNAFLRSAYTISLQSDRMGYRLEGPDIERRRPANEMITEPTTLGCVQVPAGGSPIVLMADRQTAGGYPVIATVITVDIRRLAQMGPGEQVCFQAVSLKGAQARLQARERLLTTLEVGASVYRVRPVASSMAAIRSEA